MNAINRRTVVAGLIALIVGVAIGVGTVRLKAGTPGAGKMTNDTTNQMDALANPLAGPAWDPFQEIHDMQLRMDRMFNQMDTQFHAQPQFSGIAENPSYSLSLNMQDLKNRYEVSAFLPDAKVSDVNVKLENNRTLKVDVSNQQAQSTDKTNLTTNVAEWGQYEQVIQLPTPVKANEMKITRKEHELLITLPKA